MTQYTRKQIIDKAKEIAQMIATTNEVDFFKQAEEKINKNEKVQKLIAQIKIFQKESVNLQHFQKHEALKENEAKINELMAELDGIPIVQEFKQSQEDVNDMLQLITTTMSNKVTDEIIESTGGSQLAGKTGSAVESPSPCK